MLAVTRAAETIYVAVAAAGGAVLASLITAIATYRITSRQVASASTVAEDTRSHEVALAREERDQQRLLDAYVAVMRHVGHWTRVASKKRLDLTGNI